MQVNRHQEATLFRLTEVASRLGSQATLTGGFVSEFLGVPIEYVPPPKEPLRLRSDFEEALLVGLVSRAPHMFEAYFKDGHLSEFCGIPVELTYGPKE